MTPLQVFLISAIVVQVVSGDDAIAVNKVDRQVRGSQNCDSTVYSSSGLVYSPNYPSNYENRMDCETRIIPQVSGPYSMRFYFCDFLTENFCADYVTLNTPEKFCGDRSNTYYSQYTSGYMDTSGSFSVKFHSDRTFTKRGYKIAFCADCNSAVEVQALCQKGLTTRRPNTSTRNYRTTTRSGFTYPRHKRGFFFPKKRTTASYITSTRRPTGGFTYPFTFRYPH